MAALSGRALRAPVDFHAPPGFLTSRRAISERTPSREGYTHPTGLSSTAVPVMDHNPPGAAPGPAARTVTHPGIRTDRCLSAGMALSAPTMRLTGHRALRADT